jgi:dihydroflavonol-4-reductase
VSSEPPVLVTGGSGFLGGALTRRFVELGRPVRALARSTTAAAIVADLGARPIDGDLLDEASLEEAMRGCGTVFHAAGVSAICPRDPAEMFRTNVEGSANVVRAAARAGVRRVVFTSSGAAIGEARGAIGREDTAHRGSYLSRYERSKHLSERRALDLAAELGVDLVCVNPSSVQGPGRATGSTRLLIRLATGRLPVVIDAVVSVVDIADCTDGHLLAEAHGAPGERYLLSGAALSMRDALELLHRVMGRRPRVVFVPGSIALAGARTAELGGRLVRRDPPICLDGARTLVHGHRYDGSRAERELGLRYTPIEDTLRRTLAWLSDLGLTPRPRL